MNRIDLKFYLTVFFKKKDKKIPPAAHITVHIAKVHFTKAGKHPFRLPTTAFLERKYM